jgi:hypothetical protein
MLHDANTTRHFTERRTVAEYQQLASLVQKGETGRNRREAHNPPQAPTTHCRQELASSENSWRRHSCLSPWAVAPTQLHESPMWRTLQRAGGHFECPLPTEAFEAAKPTFLSA